MSRLVRGDRWLIERVAEPAAWWLDRWGVDMFYVARFLMVVFVAAVVADAVQTTTLFTIFMAACALAILPLRMMTITLTEGAVRRGLANHEKYHDLTVAFRVVLIGCNAVAVLAIIILWRVRPLELGNIAYLLHLYVSACDRPPPVRATAPHMVAAGGSA